MFCAAAKTKKTKNIIIFPQNNERKPTWTFLNWHTGAFMTTCAGPHHSNMIWSEKSSRGDNDPPHLPVSSPLHWTLIHITCPRDNLNKHIRSVWIRTDCARSNMWTCCVIPFIPKLKAKIYFYKKPWFYFRCMYMQVTLFKESPWFIDLCFCLFVFIKLAVRCEKKYVHEKIIKVAFTWKSIKGYTSLLFLVLTS